MLTQPLAGGSAELASSSAGDAVGARDEDGVVACDRACDLAAASRRRSRRRARPRSRAASGSTSSVPDGGSRPAAERGAELVEPPQVGGAGQRVDEPALTVSHLVSPSCAMSRETVACTASMPNARSASATSACVESGCSWTRRRIVPCRSNFVVTRAPPADVETAVGLLGASSVERRREAQRPLAGAADHEAVRRAPPRRRARRAVELDGEQQAERREPRRSEASPRSGRTLAHVREQRVVDRVDDGAGRGARDGLPPNVDAWSPGSNACGASSATSSAPIGSPFARPFASVTASGRTPSCCHAKNAPLRPTPVCTSSRISSAPCSSASARASASVSGSSGCTPPSPCTARAGSRPCPAPTWSASVAASRSARRARAARTRRASRAGR